MIFSPGVQKMEAEESAMWQEMLSAVDMVQEEARQRYRKSKEHKEVWADCHAWVQRKLHVYMQLVSRLSKCYHYAPKQGVAVLLCSCKHATSRPSLARPSTYTNMQTSAVLQLQNNRG